MKYINAQQLAFILDIKKEDAKAMIANAHAKSKGIDKSNYEVPKTERNEKGKIESDFPEQIEISVASKELNLPHLQKACDDIENEYLTRPATKKWILCDYPEKAILKAAENEKNRPPYRIDLPPALRSMIRPDIQAVIKQEWHKRFNTAI